MRILLSTSLAIALTACGGAHVASDTSAARADVYTIGATYDPGMSHVVITAVLVHDGEIVRGLVLGRFLNSCATDRYAALAHESPPDGTLLAIGCDAMPSLAESSLPVVARVLARDGALVGEWAEVVGGHPATFRVAGTFPLPEGAILRPETSDRDFRVDLDDELVVRTCHAYPDSCAP